jgi:hypothetical protein
MSKPAAASASDAGYEKASCVLFALLLLVVAITFVDYGITHDEPSQHQYGELVLEYYRELFTDQHDRRALEYRNLYLYGGLFDALVALANTALPFPSYETRHALNAFFGVLGVIGCWKLARALGGPRVAFWAALLLVLTPRYYGHMFNNPKDIPFAAAYVWSLYYLVRALPLLPRLPGGLVVKLGVAIGVAAGVRIGGLLLIGYLALAMLAFAACELRRGPPGRLLQVSGKMAVSFLGVAGLAYLLMLAFWPWAQADPIRHPWMALDSMTRFSFDKLVLFDGRQIAAPELPRSYILRLFLITSPEIVLLLTAAALIYAPVALARRWDPLRKGVAGVLLVAFAVVFPVAYVVGRHSVLYDGIRQLLFVIPPLTCLAALAGCAITSRLAERSPRLGAALSGLVVIYLLVHLTVMVRLHPYHTAYYNGTVGGIAGAYGRYETDYWGNSYREAAGKLLSYLEGEEEPNLSSTYRVALCGTPIPARRIQASSFLPSRLEVIRSTEDADFFISTTRWDCHDSVSGREILRVERFGVPLAIVKDRRSARSAEAVGPPAPPPSSRSRSLPRR